MKLRVQALSTVILYTAGLILAAILLIGTLQGSKFRELENREMEETLECSIASARNSMEAQIRLTSDWAWWDASYRFMEGEYPEHLELNLPPYVIWDSDLLFAAIIDNDLNFVWSGTRGRKKPEAVPLPLDQAEIIKRILSDNPLSGQDSLSGYADMGEGLFVALSASRILRNDGTGPEMGWLVLGARPGTKWFGPAGQIRLSPHDPDKKTMIFDRLSLQLSRNHHLPGFESAGGIDLSLSKPADLTVAGNNLLFMCVLALLAAGGLIGAVTYAWLNKNFLRRIELLQRQISRESPKFLKDSGNDEIGDLCQAFNGLLSTLREQGESHRKDSLIDPLTGLPNRRLLDDRLRHAVAAARRKNAQVALIMIDLDGFKGVNDALGHSMGDRLLRMVGDRFSDIQRDSDTIARIGGDEFAMVTEDLVDDRCAMMLGRRIRGALLQPFQVENASLQISASVGIALYPRDGDDEKKLFQAADSAMYRAKRSGMGLVHYDSSMDGTDLESTKIDEKIRETLGRGLFIPSYQEEISLKNPGEIRCRLIRPRCPDIDGKLLEERSGTNGMSAPIELMVLRKAMEKQMGENLSMDLSQWHLWNEGLPLSLAGLVRETGFEPSKLELSIDANALTGNVERWTAIMNGLASCGFNLALRNFGEQYIPLNKLADLPIKAIKTSGHVLFDKKEDRGAYDFISRTMVELATRLGIESIVTDIDDENQIDQAREKGFSAYRKRP